MTRLRLARGYAPGPPGMVCFCILWVLIKEIIKKCNKE